MSESFDSRYETPTESPGFLLWQVTNLWQRRLRQVLNGVDLTHVQFVLLASLAWMTQDEQMVTQVQLAHHAKTDITMTSQVVRTLEKKGLIQREQSPLDTRANIIHLTPTGYGVLKKALQLVEQADADFFSVLNGDLSRLNQMFLRLLQAEVGRN